MFKFTFLHESFYFSEMKFLESLRWVGVENNDSKFIILKLHCVKCPNMEFFLVRIFLYSD